MPYGVLAFTAAVAIHKPLLGETLLLFAVAARTLMAAVLSLAVLHDRHTLRTSLLFPMRDMMGFFFWAASYTSSKILWRGRVYRLRDGGRMESS